MIHDMDGHDKCLDEFNERALKYIDKVIAPLQILAARYPRVFREIMLSAFRRREGDFFESIGEVVDRSHREMREIIKDSSIPYPQRDLVAELLRFNHGAAQVRAMTECEIWSEGYDSWPLYTDRDVTTDAPTAAATLDSSRTVAEAREKLRARTGRSMRSVIAETTRMAPAQIDAIAA